MRRSTSDFGMMITEGNLVGLSLGYDACAEHECGIKQMKELLGLDIKRLPIGLADRKIKTTYDSMHFVKYEEKQLDGESATVAVLILDERLEGLSNKDILQRIQRNNEIKLYEEKKDSKWYDPIKSNMVAAWDSSGFAIKVRGEELIGHLKKIYESVDKNDLLIAPPWGKAFFRGGISLVIDSMVPAADRAEIYLNDLSNQSLETTVAASGIKEHLKANGKSWYALSPAWANEEKTEVKFFLNPCEQSKYGYGWFSMEDLQLWAVDKGPIVMSNVINKKPGMSL